MRLILCALALGAGLAAPAQAAVITSFSGNGVVVCSNLAPNSVAAVEWASSLSGPWQTNWDGPGAVTVGSNGMISVSVPMFYRVSGRTNPASLAGMVLVPAGRFAMGNYMGSGEGYSNELPLHTVYVSAFYMDRCDVTYALWQEVYSWATNHGYSFDYAGSGKATNHPVQTVSWYDSVKWCNARSEKGGLVPAYYTNAAQTVVYRAGQLDISNSWVNWSSGYRLPTEAEWEKAARGGAGGHRFPWSDADTIDWSRANYNSFWLGGVPCHSYDVNSTNGYNPAGRSSEYPYTTPVGLFAANGYGLYDMAGNVWQWCWDWYNSTWYGNTPATVDDTRGPVSGSSRLLRGGDWISSADSARCAGRNYNSPLCADHYFGFRCVRGL